MELKDVIEQRRAYRSLSPVEITEDMIHVLAHAAQLAPSCFNKQPWKYVFVYEPKLLEKMHSVMMKGNEWTYKASMIIAVIGKKEEDCVMKDGRQYYMFDIGMATSNLILSATDLGLVAHPIAGYDPKKTSELLNIPAEYEVVTLINVGKHSDQINPVLSEMQVKNEKERPERQPLEKFIHLNGF